MSLEPLPTGPIAQLAPRGTDIGPWRIATFATFAINGVIMGSWASRIPAVADGLGLGFAQLGVFVTASPLGALVGLLLSSHVLERFGERRTAMITQVIMASGISLLGISTSLLGNVYLGAVGLFLFGVGLSTTNIIINLEAASLDRRTGRTLMPAFHATWSVGSFAGAGIGALAAANQIPVGVHYPVMAAIVLVTSLVAIRFFPELREAKSTGGKPSFAERMRVWVEPRTLLIGVIVLAASFGEGTANNWLNLSMVQGRHWDPALGAFAFTVFAASMTTGRFIGGSLVDRVGRVASLRTAFALATAGILVVTVVELPGAIFAGIVLWGLGASLGYPLGVSAAADDPRNAAARVAAVATLASISGLAGPSLVGLLSEGLGLPHAFVAIAALLAVGLLVSGAARRPPTA